MPGISGHPARSSPGLNDDFVIIQKRAIHIDFARIAEINMGSQPPIKQHGDPAICVPAARQSCQKARFLRQIAEIGRGVPASGFSLYAIAPASRCPRNRKVPLPAFSRVPPSRRSPSPFRPRLLWQDRPLPDNRTGKRPDREADSPAGLNRRRAVTPPPPAGMRKEHQRLPTPRTKPQAAASCLKYWQNAAATDGGRQGFARFHTSLPFGQTFRPA